MPPKRKPPSMASVRRGRSGCFAPPLKQTRTVEEDESDASDDSEAARCSNSVRELEERKTKEELEKEKALDEAASKGTLTLKESYMSCYSTDRSFDSKTVEVKGMPWYFTAYRHTENDTAWLKISLYGFSGAHGASELPWGVDVKADFIVVNENEANNIVKSISTRFDHTKGACGFSQLIKWEDLINADKGFMSKSGIYTTIKVNFTLSNIVGIRKSPLFNFTSPDPRHDLTVVIDGKKLYTSRQILSIHSPVLNALLYGDSEQSKENEIVLNEVKYEDFIEMLHYIYPGKNEITKHNVPGLLAVGGRFQIQELLDQLEQFLIKFSGFNTATKLKFAVENRLVQLQDRCLSSLKSSEDIKNLSKSDAYKKFDDSTKIALFDSLMKMTK